MAQKRREELETRLLDLEQELEGLLERNLSDEDIAEVKARLEQAYFSKQDVEVQMLEDLKKELSGKSDENEKLKVSVDELQRRVKAGALPGGKTVAQQIAGFDAMKKSLMRDFQNRCEWVRFTSFLSQHQMLTYTGCRARNQPRRNAGTIQQCSPFVKQPSLAEEDGFPPRTAYPRSTAVS